MGKKEEMFRERLREKEGEVEKVYKHLDLLHVEINEKTQVVH